MAGISLEKGLMKSTAESQHLTVLEELISQDAAIIKVWRAIWMTAVQIEWRPILAFWLPFVLYLRTLAPTIYNLDSAELTTAAATGGLMRATGYPLYLTIGSLWSKIPIGDVGFRMNLFSAFCGALTILLADRILKRWKVGSLAALGALGLLATSPYFWGLSLIAEVYTLHTAIMAGLILALLRWGERPATGRMMLVGIVAGVGLSHHMATVLLIPGSLFYLLVTAPRRALAPRSVGAGFLGLLVGLSFYLYLPLRYLAGPAFNYAGAYDSQLNFLGVNLTSLEGIFWLVSGRAFTSQMFAYQGLALWEQIKDFGILLTQAFFVFGITPGLLGLFVLFRRSWRQAAMLLLMFALSAGFYVDYAVIDKDTMFLPAFLVWGLWAGVGYQALFDWLKANLEEKRLQRWGLVVAQGGMICAVLLALAWNWRIADLSGDRSAREYGEEILKIAKPEALIFGWWDTVPVIQYLQLVEGQRPDVTAINRFLVSYEELTIVIRQNAGTRPIYIDSVPAALSAFVASKPRGPLYELLPNNRITGGNK
jgi:4-amino-4-deoxy-L-arabinose transferase-like glycosyltransferase